MVIIATCKYIKYGAYLDYATTAPFKPFNKNVEWRLETKTSLLSTIVHNHKASKYGAG
jgi:hypothetical protein